MTYGAYLSTAGMQANEYRQNIMANNLANADTHGFKHDLAVFSQRPVASRTAPGGPSMRHPVAMVRTPAPAEPLPLNEQVLPRMTD